MPHKCKKIATELPHFRHKRLYFCCDNKWDILVTKSFDEKYQILGPYFEEKKRQYKARSYNKTVMTQMILAHRYNQNTVVFTDKAELQDICKENMIDYYKFINYCKAVGYVVEFEVVVRKVKHNVEGMSKAEFDAYCKANNISKQYKSDLKKRYGIQ